MIGNAGIRLSFEGRKREAQYMKGRWWDELHYAILEHEWRARVR